MSRKDQKKLEEKLAKFKNKSIHDRLAGTNTSNHNDMDTSISIDDNKNNNTDTVISDDTSISTSMDTSKDNDTDIDIITSMDNDISTSIIIDKDTSDGTDIINVEDIITRTGKVKSKIISTDNDIDNGISTTVLPKVETEEKKYVTLYLRKGIAQLFDDFVRDQVKKQKLKNVKIKSFYGEIAIEEFLRKHGYTENKKT